MPRKPINAVERARDKFRPRRITVLFIAEAPPADPTRFFYFDSLPRGDSLFIEMTRQLYADARSLKARDLRSRKRELLDRFAADGYYLADARAEPMPRGVGASTKTRLLKEALPELLKQVRRLSSADTKVVLISRSVYDACLRPLKRAGVKVLNTEMIDFPGSSRQPMFRRKLRRLLHRFRSVPTGTVGTRSLGN
jgi:hypothetical protein